MPIGGQPPGFPVDPTDPNISGAFVRPGPPSGFSIPSWILYAVLASSGGGLVGGIGDFIGNGEVNRRIESLEKEADRANAKLDSMDNKLRSIEGAIVRIETTIRFSSSERRKEE